MKFFLIFVTLAVLTSAWLLEPWVQRMQVDKAIKSMQNEMAEVKVEFDNNGRAFRLVCRGLGDSPMNSSEDVKSQFDVDQLPKLKQLKELELSYCIVGSISPFEKLRQLELLNLSRCEVDFESSDRPWQIEELSINRTKFPLPPIPMPKLKSLNIRRSGFGMGFTPSETRDKPQGFDFRPFQGATALEEIWIRDEFVTNFHGLQWLDRLKTITTDDCRIYSIEGVDLLGSLEHLDISCPWRGPMRVTAVEKLGRCKSLRYLDVGHNLSVSGQQTLKDALPNCEIRAVSGFN